MLNVVTNLNDGLTEKQIEIHIRIKQRNGRKCITIIENLNDLKADLEQLSKHFKKTFNCRSTVIKPENTIELAGDHRESIKNFLINEKLVTTEQIKIHGY